MKLKNIKNSVVVLNSVWICKGTNNGFDYDSDNTNFKVKKIYDYLCNNITDTSKKEIGKIDKFSQICKDNTDFIKYIIEYDLENLKKIDKAIMLIKGLMGRYKSGPLNGYFECTSFNKAAYTVDDSIKKELHKLVTNSLNARDELNNKLNGFKNKFDTKEDLDAEINKLKNDAKYKDIIKFKEFDDKIKNIKLKEIKDKTSEKKGKGTHKDKTDDEKKKENKKKEEARLKNLNEKLNGNLKNLKKSIDENKDITSIQIQEQLKNSFIDNNEVFITEADINEENKGLIEGIKQEIQKRGSEEMDKANKNKTDEQKKSDLIEKLATIINTSKDKKSSDVEIDLNSILGAQTYQEFVEQEEVKKLIEEIKEIINNKKEEEKPKPEEEDEDGEDEEEEEEDKDKDKNNNTNSNDLPPAPTPVEEKKDGCCGNNKKAAPADKKGCCKK